ncbi:general stress protein [Sphingomonas sp. TDK1]|uniref:general stress protein n=1 Tax=Sphingomonas sp. TDK1 TaxID=453247 RepID=UPI0007D9510A|nr:general stress protein [Sphingomonas sp. TDK1]OAN57186.1 hypothetical protein A7X12_08145 [Sphingomonas sp. TDK1]
MSRTITRLFDDYSDAKAAVSELERLGVPHSDLSIVANNTHGDHDVTDVNEHGDVTRGASTGAALGGVGGLLAGLGLLAIPGLGPIVAAGWLASTAAGAAIGGIGGAATGGIVGALKNAGESEADAHVYSEGVRRGGTLVSARVSDELAPRAESVLNGRGVDAATRGAAYRQSGWTAFDDKAPAYTRDEIERERAAYREPTVL